MQKSRQNLHHYYFGSFRFFVCFHFWQSQKLEQNLIFRKAIYLDPIFVVAAITEHEQIVNEIDDSKKEKMCLCMAINHRKKNCECDLLIAKMGHFNEKEKEKENIYWKLPRKSIFLHCYPHYCLILNC